MPSLSCAPGACFPPIRVRRSTKRQRSGCRTTGRKARRLFPPPAMRPPSRAIPLEPRSPQPGARRLRNEFSNALTLPNSPCFVVTWRLSGMQVGAELVGRRERPRKTTSPATRGRQLIKNYEYLLLKQDERRHARPLVAPRPKGRQRASDHALRDFRASTAVARARGSIASEADAR